MAKKYEISRVVIAQAKKMGFDEPILPKIKKMLINSDEVIKLNPQSQVDERKFEDYLFSIFNGVVCVIKLIKKVKPFATPTHYKCHDCKDTRKVNVFEDCSHCAEEYAKTGMGYATCQWCFGEGGVNKLIPCQTCSGKHRKIY